jgi:hypothetical protein
MTPAPADDPRDRYVLVRDLGRVGMAMVLPRLRHEARFSPQALCTPRVMLIATLE